MCPDPTAVSKKCVKASVAADADVSTLNTTAPAWPDRTLRKRRAAPRTASSAANAQGRHAARRPSRVSVGVERVLRGAVLESAPLEGFRVELGAAAAGSHAGARCRPAGQEQGHGRGEEQALHGESGGRGKWRHGGWR